MSQMGKTFLSVTAITLAIIFKLAPAQAQVFSALQDQGGVLGSDPNCTNGNALAGAATCAVVGVDGALYVNRFDGSGFTDLGGIVIGKPSCTQFGPNPQALCAVVGTDASIFVNVSSRVPGNPSWSGFRPLGGVSISDPACTGLLPRSNQAICAIIRPNGSLAVAISSDGAGQTWTTFTDLNLGGTHKFNPTCAAVINFIGALCGAVTTAGDFRVKFFNGTTWDASPTIVTFAPPNTNISIVSDPSCTFVTGSNGQQAICAVRGSDSALYVAQLNGPLFPQFQSLGGIIVGVPSCSSEIVEPGNPKSVCAVRGILNELFVNQYNNGIWSGFQPIPGTIINGDPSCRAVQPGPGGSSLSVVWCGVKSTASQLWVTVSSPPM